MSGTVVAIFIPAFLTLLLAAGSVFVFRGSYYKSLPGEVERLNGLVTRLSQENIMLKDLVIGKAELKEIISILTKHDAEAERRHETSVRMIDVQHSEILGAINVIKINQSRRDADDK